MVVQNASLDEHFCAGSAQKLVGYNAVRGPTNFSHMRLVVTLSGHYCSADKRPFDHAGALTLEIFVCRGPRPGSADS